VHRDVSPQNVLVTTRGVAKLIDFGIAKASGRLQGETNVDQLKGKVQYMPPEQALGKPVDRRSDVWAVGAVLYHLIAGRPPYEGANEIQTLFQVTSGRPPVPLTPTVPAAIREVVRRALCFSPGERYATAAELQHALEGAIIQSGLATSTSAVASFLAEIVGDRAAKRQEAIALGLKAASEREKIAGIMRSNAETTNATSDTGVRVGTALAQLETNTSATGRTLGSAAMAISTRQRRRSVTVSIAAGSATLVLAAAIAAVTTHSSKPATVASPGPAALPAKPEPVAPAVPPSPATDTLWEAVTPTPTVVATATPADLPAPETPRRTARGSSAPPAATTAKPAGPSAKERENYGF
jgi:serine/threonine-protein kinase